MIIGGGKGVLGVLLHPQLKAVLHNSHHVNSCKVPETGQSRSRYSNRAVTPIEQSP